MLELKNIYKDYKMPTYKVEALKDVNLVFRRNEFVSVLGPSGSGKTTLLNLIGGLDKYTSGDLIINGTSTKEFKSKDWDVYRNHRVGFVFQSYNLIPHQTVLKNVELALTIAGYSKEERIEKAKKALDSVGLSDQYYKKPNQLSGGQSQRVAIARALVNDPDILLADEPTGALDTKTSKQILEIIKEISKERLVIMVTHNADLAEEYSTRIINLLDGRVTDDSNPLTKEELEEQEKQTIVYKEKTKEKKEKTKMSLFTTFLLSLNNLISKKSRTILTSIASSIGIIGISLVLSVSYGLTEFIGDLQDDMLSGNPVMITKDAFDINAAIEQMNQQEKLEIVKENGIVNVEKMIEQIREGAQTVGNLFVENVITEDYINYVKEIPKEDIAALFFDYEIDVTNNIYFEFKESADADSKIISLSVLKTIATDILKQNETTKPYASLASNFIAGVKQTPDNEEYILSQYDVLAGKMATKKNEIMIVVNKDRMVSDFLLAQLGYYNLDEFINEVLRVNVDPNYNYDLPFSNQFTYEELMAKKFVWYPNDVVFNKTMNPVNPFTYNAYKSDFADPDVAGVELEIVGILEPKENIHYGTLKSGFYYTEELANYIIEQNKNSEVVAHLKDNYEKEEDMVYRGMYYEDMPIGITYNYTYTYNGEEKNNIGFVGKHNSVLELIGMMGGGSDDLEIYTLSLRDLGGNELAGTISIYPKDLNHKKNVLNYLDTWNKQGVLVVNGVTLKSSDREKVTYSDPLSIIFKMINDAINLVTIALIVFTSLALVVSSVMIAIITYVSVVERTNEIGVIRSIGGRKRDVSNLFIAETFVIGLTAGLFAIAVTYAGSAIINLIVNKHIGGNIAKFSWNYALIMVSISIILSLVSGLIPSRSAARKDPVDALRAE